MSNSSDRKYRRAHRSLWTLALATFRSALRKGLPLETKIQVFAGMGRCLKEQYLYASAREKLLKSLQLYGGPRIQLVDALAGQDQAVPALVMLTQCDLALDRPKEAKTAVREGLEREPDDKLRKTHAQLV